MSRTSLKGETASEENARKTWLVEKILKKRVIRGKDMYYIKWLGCGKKYNSWEPKRNIRKLKSNQIQNTFQSSQLKDFHQLGKAKNDSANMKPKIETICDSTTINTVKIERNIKKQKDPAGRSKMLHKLSKKVDKPSSITKADNKKSKRVPVHNSVCVKNVKDSENVVSNSFATDYTTIENNFPIITLEMWQREPTVIIDVMPEERFVESEATYDFLNEEISQSGDPSSHDPYMMKIQVYPGKIEHCFMDRLEDQKKSITPRKWDLNEKNFMVLWNTFLTKQQRKFTGIFHMRAALEKFQNENTCLLYIPDNIQDNNLENLFFNYVHCLLQMLKAAIITLDDIVQLTDSLNVCCDYVKMS